MLTSEDYKQWYDENKKYSNNHYVCLKKINGKIKPIIILNAKTLKEIDYDNS